MGFDIEARKCGKVIVGDILARNFDVGRGNWHEVVYGMPALFDASRSI